MWEAERKVQKRLKTLFRLASGSWPRGGPENDAIRVVWPTLVGVWHQDKSISDDQRQIGTFQSLGCPDATPQGRGSVDEVVILL